MTDLYAGLMSGTSLDGVDAVLADLGGPRPRILAHSHVAFDPALRAELLALNSPGGNELERAALAGNALARHYAQAIVALDLPARGTVRAIGCHGQTVRHRPERGYTLQIGNAALLAELTGCRVVSDFRSRDVAAGGQGAPLAPAFHAAAFASTEEDRVALNLGGFANITWLPRVGTVLGFDTGPANCLMDLWAARHLGTAHDEDGAWAVGGAIDDALLARLLEEPYFHAPPPKSTGRDLFNGAWLDARLRGGENPRAVQATLLELTARSVANAIARHAAGARRVIACGGGARNGALMRRLTALLAPAAVEASDRHGMAPGLVEATAFAWLAQQALDGKPGNLPAVTGARGVRVLGTLYPG
ncbi:MAG: anhydro-N-acetylmuramic acid kinase [Betaproteobacteria bacterium]